MVSSILFDDFYPLSLGEVHDPIWLKRADFQHLGRVENPPSNNLSDFARMDSFKTKDVWNYCKARCLWNMFHLFTLQLWDGATWRSEAWTEWIWRGVGWAGWAMELKSYELDIESPLWRCFDFIEIHASSLNHCCCFWNWAGNIPVLL